LVLINRIILLGHGNKKILHIVILGLCRGHSVGQNPTHWPGKWLLPIIGRCSMW